MARRANNPGWLARMGGAALRTLGGALDRFSVSSMSLAQFVALTRPRAGATLDAYSQSAWVHSAVSVVTRGIAGLPPVLRRGAGTEPLTGGRAFDLVQRPSANTTWADLVGEIVGHLLTGGEAHVLPDDQVLLRPRALHVASRGEMQADRNPDGSLRCWWYTPLGAMRRQAVLPEADFLLRLFNTTDRIRGLSPLEVAALGISQDYRASVYNDSALANGAAPGGIYAFPGRVSPDERDEYLRVIAQAHGGPSKANLPLVAGGGLTYVQTSWRNVDLQLIEGRKFNREEIYAVIGVPPVMASVFDAAHYNVAPAARKIYLFNTFIPLKTLIEALFNTRILPLVEPGVTLELDLTHNDIWQEVQREKVDSFVALTDVGVPYNHATRLLGLSLPDVAWGERSLVASTRATVEQVIEGIGPPPELPLPAPAAEPDEDEAASEPQTDGVTFATLAAEARIEERLVRASEPAIRRAFRAFFRVQEQRVSKRLEKAFKGSEKAAAQPGGAFESDADAKVKQILLDATVERGKLRQMARGYFPAAMRSTLRSELLRLGFDEKRIDAVIERYIKSEWFTAVLREKEIRVANIETVTRERLRKTLVEGIEKGETVQDLTGRITETMDVNQARALRIARSEAGQAVSTGRFLASAAAGAKAKAWLTGASPRPTHIEAGRRYSPDKAIAFTQTFDVGGEALLYPRDPRGSAGEIVNCNCVMVTLARPANEQGGGMRLLMAIGQEGSR